MTHRITFVVVALAAGACGKTSSPSPAPAPAPSPARSPTSLSCEQIFAPPASGELLCDEHVVPTSGVADEIHWRSYGLVEDRSATCDRYLDAARRCNLGFAFKPPMCDVDDHTGRSAAVFFKDPSSMGGANYPKCSRSPDAKHNSVVVISEKHPR